MYMFMWKSIDELTHRYHTEGGLLVVAASLKQAERYVNCERAAVHVSYSEPEESFDLITLGTPDKVWPLYDNAEPYVAIFPDAGCC